MLEMSLLKRIPVEKDFACTGKQGNVFLFFTVWFSSFLHVECNYGGICEVCRHPFFLKFIQKSHRHVVVQNNLYRSTGIQSFPGNFLQLTSFAIVLTPSTLGGRSRSLSRGFWDICCYASWKTVYGRLRRWLKYSSHLSPIPSCIR